MEEPFAATFLRQVCTIADAYPATLVEGEDVTRRHRAGHPTVERVKRRAQRVPVRPSTQAAPSRILRLLLRPHAIAAAVGAVVIGVAIPIAVAFLHPGEIADRFAATDPIGVMVSEAADIAVASAEPFNIPSERAGNLATLLAESTAPVLDSHVFLYLRGQRNESIAITNMAIRVLRCGPRLRGSLAFLSGMGGGVQPNVKLSVSIDSEVPWLTEDSAPGTTPRLEPYFQNNHILLQYDERTVISIAAHATQGYCEWDVEIEYLVADQATHLIVNRTGVLKTGVDLSPFRITAKAPLNEYQQVYVGGGSHWVLVPRDALCTRLPPRLNLNCGQ